MAVPASSEVRAQRAAITRYLTEAARLDALAEEQVKHGLSPKVYGYTRFMRDVARSAAIREQSPERGA